MILDVLVANTVRRINHEKVLKPLELLKEEASLVKNNNGDAFKKALQKQGMSFICEVKKASPSKGLIAENFDFCSIAAEYENVGADCISVLTEPSLFLGSDEYLAAIAKTVKTPLLRKDFTIDDYMLYQAKICGAGCVLLICSVLDTLAIHHYLDLCEQLDLVAIVEAHDKAEVESAVSAGADIIGVNNRNLKTFEVDICNSIRLREYVGDKAIFVAESGINTRSDISVLEQGGVDAVLIGEALMRTENKRQKLDELRGFSREN